MAKKHRRLNNKKKTAIKTARNVETVEEEFDGNSRYVMVVNPTDWDVRDEVSQLDSFRDFTQHNDSDSLTFGDY